MRGLIGKFVHELKQRFTSKEWSKLQGIARRGKMGFKGDNDWTTDDGRWWLAVAMASVRGCRISKEEQTSYNPTHSVDLVDRGYYDGNVAVAECGTVLRDAGADIDVDYCMWAAENGDKLVAAIAKRRAR